MVPRAHQESKSQTAGIFAQLTAQSRNTSQRAAPFSLKIAPAHGDLYPHLVHHSLGPPKSSTGQPKGHPISSAVFAGLTTVTDKQTDHTSDTSRSVTIGHIYVRSTAMWPNNIRDNVYSNVSITVTAKVLPESFI